MTQVELAERAEVSNSYLSRIEGGKRHPSTDVLKRISEALNISIVVLVFLADRGGSGLPKSVKESLSYHLIDVLRRG